MASEKKPSIYFDRGTIGSAEELDEYGVWVKSEPQDLPSAAADDIFDDPSLSYMRETPDFGDESYIEDIPVPDMSDSDEGFDAEGGFGAEVHTGEGGQQGASAEMSTQLLMKIAEELSSIRSELTTLKNEFAGVHSDAGADYKPDAPHSGFFAEEDDEKIALTGDEMYNILNAADFSEVETLSIDPLQSFDDGMLDMLSDQEDITHFDLSEPVASSEDEEEEIEIDLTDLGINLDEIEANEEANALDLSPQPEIDDSFNANFDILPEDNVPDGEVFAVEDAFTQNSGDESLEETEIESFDGLDELQHISLDDEPLIAAHEEDTSYLEEDPLAMQETELNDLAETENALDISLDAIDLDLNIDEPSEESLVAFEDVEEPSFDASSLDFSEAIIDEPDLSAGITESPEQEPVLDDISDEDVLDEDISIELEGNHEFESPVEENPAAEEKDDSIAQVIPEGFEIVAEEAPVPFDDDLETLTEEDLVGPEDLSENLQEENPAPEAVKEDEAAAEEALAEEPISIPSGLKSELKNVLSYMDHLLESLPEEKIEEFAKSEYFDSYKKLFKELGLV